MVGFGVRRLAPRGVRIMMVTGFGQTPSAGRGVAMKLGVGRPITTEPGHTLAGAGAGALGHTTNIGARP